MTHPPTEPTKIRTVIVDDEELGTRPHPVAPRRCSPTSKSSASAPTAPSAVETIERAQPDLVFLDVQMPGMDGFEVDRESRSGALAGGRLRDGARRTRDSRVRDPRARLPAQAVRSDALREGARARAHADRRERKGPVIDSRLVSLLEELREERKYPERLIVKSSGRVFFVRTEEIDWVEASGNYVKIHTKSEAHLLRESMKNMEAKLDPKIFVRIHRSAIVNIDRIKELEPWFHGEYIVIMRDGTRLTASRVFSDRLSALIA